jgi:DNA-binding NtrC family response regulator
MRINTPLPRLLVIDDLFGRQLKDRPNRERANLCGMYGLRDVTGDEAFPPDEEIVNPIAEAVFFRGQRPLCTGVGDTVVNDLETTMFFVRQGWQAEEHDTARWSIVLLDLCFYTGPITRASDKNLPGMPEGRPGDDDAGQYFGLRILERLHTEFPELPVIILSSKERDEVSRSFTDHGALGFIPRTDSDSPEKLYDYLWRHGLIPDPSGQMAGRSLGLLLALRTARRAAQHRENILIRGERGAGKELLARYIHRAAVGKEGRPPRPFLTVNSAVFSPGLFASELFGIQAKTATGVDGKVGLIESAHGGDLFLDEIADMPHEVQAAVLRVLQERKVTPVGGRQPRDVNVRFISATNADLEDRARGFRPDLLDRLRLGGTIWLPPLRERIDDIPLLVEKFVREAESERQGAMRREVNREAFDLLCAHDWPGNIRELHSVIFEAVNRFPDVEHLVARHLRIERKEAPGKRTVASRDAASRTHPPIVSVRDHGTGTLTDLLERMQGVSFDENDPRPWTGRLSELQSAYARLLAGYIKAALLATRKPTPENPDGDILIHPAMKLLSGDRRLTTVKAADLIKRLLNLSPADWEDILADPVLRTAYDTATRLRPRQSRKKEVNS